MQLVAQNEQARIGNQPIRACSNHVPTFGSVATGPNVSLSKRKAGVSNRLGFVVVPDRQGMLQALRNQPVNNPLPTKLTVNNSLLPTGIDK